MGSISKDKPNTTQHREKLARRLLSFPSLYFMGESKRAERSETWIIRVVLMASTEPKKNRDTSRYPPWEAVGMEAGPK